jgi:uncharacterized protein (TIGR02996 family)
METVFLEEIAHNPHDETPVLIYADWLTEQDDPALVSRGEFLRLESILKRGKPGPQRSDMEWQVRQLWWDHIEDWLGPLYDAVDHFRYERGFLSVEVSDRTLAGITADDLAGTLAWDWVRHVGVRKGGLDALALLSELPRPRFLVSVDVGRKAIEEVEEELPVLLAMPILQELRELTVAENGLSDVGCAQLARWAPLASLRKLVLRKNEITCVGVRSLLDSPHLGCLEELDLGDNFIQTDGARDLCQTVSLPRLKRLDLSYNSLNYYDLAALQKVYGDGVQTYPSRQTYGPSADW